MRVTRNQLRQLIIEEARKSEDPMTALTDHLDDLIKSGDKDGLTSALKKLQRLVDHYSDAEILQ